MKKIILLLICAFHAMSGLAQTYDIDEWRKDTVVIIPYKSKGASSCIRLDNGVIYHLSFYKDFSTYELCISLPQQSLPNDMPGHASPILISTISWGDYRISRNKMLFNDRITGLKMKASVEPEGIKFCKDYFPDINSDILEIYLSDEGMHVFFALFDDKKARRFRRNYDREHRDPFELISSVYGNTIEIRDDGKWKHKHGDLVLAEGEWRRKRNILILNSPKLNCNFYMTIGEKRLGSMLILGDILGYKSYYLSE